MAKYGQVSKLRQLIYQMFAFAHLYLLDYRMKGRGKNAEKQDHNHVLQCCWEECYFSTAYQVGINKQGRILIPP